MSHTNMILDKAAYPRPDFVRKNWMDLNGEWEFAFPSQIAHAFPKDYQHTPLAGKILVPFCCSCEASTIGCSEYHETVYYARSFSVQEEQLAGEVLIHFGAVDYDCDIWVNQAHAGSHHGGHTHFQLPISSFLHSGENRIFLLVRDDKNCDRPRGKQYWSEHPDRCWYTNTIGIWKSVWLEFTSEIYIERVKLTPDIDRRHIELEVFFNTNYSGTLTASVFFGDKLRKTVQLSFADSHYLRELISIAEEDSVDEIHYWSCEHPNLYNLSLNLTSGDLIECYFGMRKIETQNGQVLLNNRPLYQRLILDQGYWPDTLMTPPSPDAVKKDIELTKKMGFNGARKHQKLEAAHYYYWADVLGLLVWCEMPSGYAFNDQEIHTVISEWEEILMEAYNHPCIITWVPFNESWGIRNVLTDSRQQALASSVYYLTKAYDPVRPISTNDGWEIPAHTDLFCIHDYEVSTVTICDRYENIVEFSRTGLPARQALAHNAAYRNQPFLLTEYGGIALYEDEVGDNWGYNAAAETWEDYQARLNELTDAIRALPYCRGYCYTQLTDVMQEVNGLLYADRRPKMPIEILERIFSKNP